MLRDFLTRTGIARLLSRIRIGGHTVNSTLRESRNNTKRNIKRTFRDAVLNDDDVGTFSQSLQQTIKTRKRETRSTLKNVMSGVRGQARAVLATGRRGIWRNIGTLDSGTTPVCASHMGMTWNIPYSQIPNKPPRRPPVHPCRSFLQFTPEGEGFESEASFEEQFNESEELQRELLGPTRFEAFQRGDLPIKTFAQYERSVLFTLAELNLE